MFRMLSFIIGSQGREQLACNYREDSRPNSSTTVFCGSFATAEFQFHGICGGVATAEFQYHVFCGDFATAEFQYHGSCGGFASAEFQYHVFCGDFATAEFQYHGICGVLQAAEFQYHGTCDGFAAVARYLRPFCKPPNSSTMVFAAVLRPPNSSTMVFAVVLQPPNSSTTVFAEVLQPPNSSTTVYAVVLQPLNSSTMFFAVILQPPNSSAMLFAVVLQAPNSSTMLFAVVLQPHATAEFQYHDICGVLQPHGSRKRRFQYYICTTISRKFSRLTETSIPVLNLYYDLTNIQPPAPRGAENHERAIDREQNCEDAPRPSAARGRKPREGRRSRTEL